MMQNEFRWQKIQAFQLDDPGAALSFTDRLMRENGWSLAFALQAVEEYKKFMYLVCMAPHPLTPSDQVDQVWHLHLIYTQSYWNDFCKNVLEREVHHGPTKGGKKEGSKFTDWYEKTKELYHQEFGQEPPLAIWPPAGERFSDINFQRVNMRRHWLLKKPRFLQK